MVIESEPFVSADMAEIETWYDEHAKVRLRAHRPLVSMSKGLRLDHRRIGALGIASSRVPTELTVTTSTAQVYAVAVVTAGSLHVSEGRRTWELTPAVAGLYRPPRTLRRTVIAARTEMTYVLIDRREMERRLERLVDEYVEGPVDFGPLLPLRSSPAWWHLFRVYAESFGDPGSAVLRPAVHEPLHGALINALLYAADHRYQDLLRRPRPTARPRHIRLVVDAIRAEPARPYTVAVLARIAGVSVRSLQQGFQLHVGMTPIAYLRRVRLEHAHADLLTADNVTVAQVAHRWGFTHLGRFAAFYAAVYGVTPSVTRSRFPESPRPGYVADAVQRQQAPVR